MTGVVETLPKSLPDHTQLPDSDGNFVKNFQEHPQSILLTESIWPILETLHPDGQFCIGQDSGIYWRMTEPPEPPQRGAVSPDWFYVPNVSPTLNGMSRRSYVMWQEFVAPLIVLEFVSATGAEERDTTPYQGKFWVYEQVLRVPFYGIYEVEKASIEMYSLEEGIYTPMSANDRGHYPIPRMAVEIGIWPGVYKNMDLPWLRWWDSQGNLLPTGEERAEREKRRADRLAARLRELGIDPEEE
jgi:Putative restriction endonuclease